MQWREVLGYFVKERSLYKTAHHKRGMWFKWQDMYHTPMNYANVLVHWWRVIIRLSSGNLGSLGPIAPSPFRKDSTTPLDALSFRLIHSFMFFLSCFGEYRQYLSWHGRNYLIGQSFGGQNCQKSGSLPKILSVEIFCPLIECQINTIFMSKYIFLVNCMGK